MLEPWMTASGLTVLTRMPCGQEVAACEHGVAQLPVVERRLRDRGARREARRGDEYVDAAVLEHGPPDHLLHGVLAGHVGLDGDRAPSAVGSHEFLRDLGGPVAVEIGDDDMRAARAEEASGRTPDAARAARDDRDAAGELP